MNYIAIFILLALLFDLTVHIVADYLNLKFLDNSIPQEFDGIYDPIKYKSSQEYLKVNTYFDWVVSFVDILVLLLFWFLKGFEYLDQWVISFGFGVVGSGLIYLGVMAFAKMIFSLPFSIYETFVIEKRFGFNTTTWSIFLVDIIKGLALGILIGGPLLAGIIAFFAYSGPNGWLYCWIAVVLFSLLIQFFAPRFILPLFNKFVPLEAGELKDAIMAYAQKVKFNLSDVFIMDGSKRSKKSNAFFIGFGKNRRIVFFDTIVSQLNVSEMVSVLSHEVGHYKKKHIMKNIAIAISQTGVMFYFLSIALTYKGLFDAFYITQPSVYTGLIVFGLLYSTLEFFLNLAINILSRKHEYEADRFALETYQNPESLISGLKKLTVNNLGNLKPHPLYAFLNYSHPPILERINYIRNTKYN